MIDFRMKAQYIDGWYIWIDAKTIQYGKNGTSKHFKIERSGANRLDEIEVLKEIQNN